MSKPATAPIDLSDQERRAVNEFLGDNWGDFVDVAQRYLSPSEIEELGTKLEGEV